MERRYTERGLYFALALLVFVPSVSWAEGTGVFNRVCKADEPPISVTADNNTIMDAVCSAALDSVDLLEMCGLKQVNPIEIEVMDDPIANMPGCLGVYHCSSETILLISPNGLDSSLPAESPLRSIPVGRLFASIATHELAHAFLYQLRGGPGATIAEDEYVAYAMQFFSLSDVDRQALLAAVPGYGSTVTLDMLNDLMLGLAPTVFGSWAWRHFDKQSDGCKFVADIVAGKVDFALDTGHP